MESIPKELVYATVVVGMVLGSGILTSVVWVWLKKQVFGMGGTVLTLFGVVLAGLSVWGTVQVSVGPDGSLEASLQQRLESLEDRVEENDEQVEQVLTDVISTVETLPGASTEQVTALKQHKRIAELINQGEYQQALELDPDNRLALGRLVESKVDSGDYQEATELAARASTAETDAYQFRALPDLILAYDKTGRPQDAKAAVGELEKALAMKPGDSARGKETTQKLRLQRDLKRIEEQVDSPELKRELQALDRKVEANRRQAPAAGPAGAS